MRHHKTEPHGSWWRLVVEAEGFWFTLGDFGASEEEVDKENEGPDWKLRLKYVVGFLTHGDLGMG